MAATRYPTRHIRSGRRGLYVLEGIFALSVIAGLMFVTVRIMNMGVPETWNQAADTALDKADTSIPTLDASGTKTP